MFSLLSYELIDQCVQSQRFSVEFVCLAKCTVRQTINIRYDVTYTICVDIIILTYSVYYRMSTQFGAPDKLITGADTKAGCCVRHDVCAIVSHHLSNLSTTNSRALNGFYFFV